MIKRTLDISTGPSYLSVENDQLLILRDRQEVGRAPCEDVGLLLIDHPAVTITQGLLNRLMHYGAAVVICGPDHLPAGVLLPLSANELTGRRVRLQARVKLPVRKRLWKQIVRRKILLQAQNLPADHRARPQLVQLAHEVKSGDRTNAEGRAAAIYFPALFGREFRRDPEGEPPNSLLNYGYAVLRSAVGRAIVSAGLHPALSLQHQHRNNAFALADDLLEPFRPLADAAVLGLMKQEDGGFVNRAAKERLLSLMTAPVRVADQTGPLWVQLQRVVVSLVRCYEGTAERLDLPTYPAQTEQTAS